MENPKILKSRYILKIKIFMETCSWCGRKFEGSGAYAGFLNTNKYCSSKCVNEANPPRQQSSGGGSGGGNSSGGCFGTFKKIIKWIIIIIVGIVILAILTK